MKRNIVFFLVTSLILVTGGLCTGEVQVEESKGFVKYIVGRYGKEGILEVLEHMKRGEEVETAVLRSLSIALDRLEEEWHGSLKKKMTWFIYLSYHIYEILFTVLALLVIVAFIRAMVKKRAYRKGEAE
jgi:hypothetical protein